MWRWYDRTEEWLALLLLAGLSLSMLLTATMRAFGKPFAGGAEFAQFLFIWTTVLGANITLRRGGQIRVDAVVSLLPVPVAKFLSAICLLLMLGFLVLLVRHGFPLALRNWQRPMGVGMLSYGYVTLALPVGAFLMIITLLRRVVSQGISGALVSDDHLLTDKPL